MTAVVHHRSFDAKPQPQTAGSQHAGDAPGESVDLALLEKVRAIRSRKTEEVDA